MTPRERLLTALRGEPVDAVPWSCYSGLLPRGHTERLLRERGMCLVTSVNAYTREMPNVEVISRDVWEGGQLYTYRTYRTPVGEVTEKRRAEPGYGSSWIVEHMIREPKDYPVVEFMVRDTVLRPNFEAVAELEADLGEDGVSGLDYPVPVSADVHRNDGAGADGAGPGRCLARVRVLAPGPG